VGTPAQKRAVQNYRAGLAEREVNTGNSAALIGIIHARQIVEDQRGCVEVFKRDGQVPGGCLPQAVRRRHLIHHARPNKAPRIVKNMAKRFLQGRVERHRKRQKCLEVIREQRRIHSIHALGRWHLCPRSLLLLLFNIVCTG